VYTSFNIQQFYALPTQCIYVFCVDVKANSDYLSLPAETLFLYQAIAGEIYGGQSDTGTGFSPTTSAFLVHIIPPACNNH